MARARFVVAGDATEDPNFIAGSDLVRYSVALGNAAGPFHVAVELWYQPIGFRWAHNLEPYKAEEPQRMVRMYNAMSQATAFEVAVIRSPSGASKTAFSVLFPAFASTRST